MNSHNRVIVIGAGIAGIGAATFLKQRGYEVQVLEAAPQAGGRARTLARRGSEDFCDVGTQYYHSNYQRALSLINYVGLSQTVSKIKGRTRFFDHRVKNGSFLLDHRLPWIKSLGIGGNLHILGFILHQLLRHHFKTYALEDKPALDQSCALKLTQSSHVEYLIKLLSAIGVLAVHEDINLYQILRLTKIILLTDYISLSGGIASLHLALSKKLNVRLETPADRIIIEGDKVTGVAIKDTREVVPADHIVVAIPPPEAAKIIPHDWGMHYEFLSSVRMPPFPLITFFLDRPLEKSVWSYILTPGNGRVISMCTDASQKNPVMVPSGKAILQAYPTYLENDLINTTSDEELIEICRMELEEYFAGFSGWIEEAHVTRHQYGVPQFPVGQNGRALDFLRMAENRTDVSFCGDYLSGGYLEPALWSAERAAAIIK